MKNASYCVSYGKEGRLQQNEQKNSFCYSPFDMLRYYKLYFYYHFIHKSLPLFIFHKIA